MKALAGGVRPTVRSYQVDPKKLNRLTREGAPVAALKWVLKNPNIDNVIPSIVDNEQLEQNIAAMTAPFGAERREVAGPRAWRRSGRSTAACAASAKASVPKGLPVADILRFLMYAEGYGQFALGREHFQTLPAEVAAVRCGSCAHCTVECPNGVHVADRLHQAQRAFA